MSEKQTKVAIYTRVSTQMQIDRQSLPSQRADLSAYSEHILNCTDYVIFEDAGYSGKNTDRPAYQEMMTRIRNHEFTHLLVYKIDRISRNLLDFSSMYAELKKLGVTFVSKNEQFDTSSAIGEAMLKIILVFAELERKMTAERVSATALSRASRGLLNGGHFPYGYHYDKTTKSISIIPEEAKIVNYIFDTYPQLKSCEKLAKHLNQHGIKNRSGNYWTSSTLHTILTNQCYIGNLVYFRRDENTKHLRDKKEWMIYENHHEPIVSKETFEKVAYLLSNNRKSFVPPTYTYPHLFSGLLVCASCGYRYHAHRTDARDNGFRPSIYVCYGRYKKDGVCHNPAVSDVRIGPFIFTFIRNVLSATETVTPNTTIDALNRKLLKGECFDIVDHIDDDSLRDLLEAMPHNKEDEYKPPKLIPTPPRKEINDLQKDLNRHKSALERLTNLYLYDSESMTKRDYVLRRMQIEDDIKNVEHDIKLAEEQNAINDPNKINLDSYYKTIDALTKRTFDYRKYIENVNLEIPKDFLTAIFSEITVLNGYPDTITFKNGVKIKFIMKNPSD